MDHDSLRRVQEAFRELLERESSQHGRFLERLRATEPDLAREVESLLGADHRAGDFLERSPPELEQIFKRHESGLPPGTSMGPYAVLKLLGRGGMGDVYLAERADEEFEKRVAIKLVRPGADSEEILDRFWRERQILANLEHPNIARLLDGGTTENGQPYLVMEHVAGEPIDRYCDHHRLSIEARLQLFRSVCAAVEYAHRNLVVHRDLKPGNIMVTAAGVPKLLDFGIAKVLTTEGLAAGTTTRTGLLPMSPEYASPEQVRAGPITTSTDVYALGLVLYELLTGQRPQKLGSLSLPEIERVVCERTPERPSAALSALPTRAGGEGETTLESVVAARSTSADRLRRRLAGDLDTVVMKALHKEPERRQRSVEELSEDVRRHLVGLPVRARADTLAYRTAKFVRRHRVGMAATTLVAVSLVGGMVGTAWQARQAAAERDRAQTEARKSEQVAGFLTDLFRAADPDETQGDTVTVGTILERGQQRIRDTLQEQPNDGTLVNGATFAAGLVTSGTGEAFSLDGVDDYVSIPHSAALEPAQITVDAWIKAGPSQGGDLSVVVDKSHGAIDATGWVIQIDRASGRVYFNSGNGSSFPGVSSTSNVLDDSWHFIAATLDGSTMKMYVDGALETSAAYSGTPAGNMRGVNIGGWWGGGGFHRWFKGLIDEVEIYNRALSAGEIADLFNAGSEGKCKPVPAPPPSCVAPPSDMISWWPGDGDAIDIAGVEVRATMLNVLGEIYRNMGRYQQAQPLLEEALTLQRRLYGSPDERVAETMSSLGALLWGDRNFEAAEPLYREALDMSRRLAEEGADGPVADLRVADNLVGLGYTLRELGKADSAETLVREAPETRRRLLGDDHPDVTKTKSQLAFVLRARGELDAAEALYRDVIVKRRASGEMSQDFPASLNNLAYLLMLKQEYSEAETLYREALSVHRSIYGEGHPEAQRLMTNLAGVLYDQGKYEEIEAVLREVVRLEREYRPAGPGLGNYLATGLGRFLAQQGRYAEAEPIVREGLEILERELEPDHRWVLIARVELGALLGKLGRFAEAERLLLQGYDALLAAGPRQQRNAQDALERLIELYESWNRIDEADAYRVQLEALRDSPDE